MNLSIDGQRQQFIPIKDFRAVHNLPADFGIAYFEPKDYAGLGRIDRAGTELNTVRAAMLDALPAAMPARNWLTFLPDYARQFETQLYAINAQVGLKDVEIEFAVAGLSDVLHHVAYALMRGVSPQITPPPSPLPASEEGESENDSPHRLRGGVRGGVNTVERNIKTPVPWQTPREIYDLLKPLARQMRKEPTLAEGHLWRYVRDKQIFGYKFRRQHAIDRFIVDFYCPDANLIIEVDGSIHDYTQKEDALRQAYLESLNLTVVRFTNDEVLHHTNDVVNQIKNLLQKLSLSSNQDSNQPVANENYKSNWAKEFFYPLYAEWLDNGVKIFSQLYPYEHQGQAWEVQLIAHAYGRAGLIVRTPTETHYVADAALACPAEGFMAALLAEIAARMLSATQS
jgi:very-short-patch-repair endonuclease